MAAHRAVEAPALRGSLLGFSVSSKTIVTGDMARIMSCMRPDSGAEVSSIAPGPVI